MTPPRTKEGHTTDGLRGVVWWNGRYVPAARARVSVFDRGFLFGDGLLETMRLYGGRPFALADHVARLAASARALAIGVEDDARKWDRRIIELARRNGLDDGVVRLTVTRGLGGELGRIPERASPTLLLHCRPLPAGLERLRRRGADVTVVELAPGPLGAHKTLGLAPAVLARRVASERGADEALLRTESGTIPEGAASNLFLVTRGGRLRTPPLDGRTLPGVTRARILELAIAAGLESEEGPITLDELLASPEAFLTSSVVEVLPIRSVDGEPIGSADRPRTRALSRGLTAMRRREMRSPG